MLKNEKGMALIPLILTIFILLVLAGATIFMIGDGFLYNKNVKNTVYQENNTAEENVVENTSKNTNNVEVKNSITSEKK